MSCLTSHHLNLFSCFVRLVTSPRSRQSSTPAPETPTTAESRAMDPQRIEGQIHLVEKNLCQTNPAKVVVEVEGRATNYRYQTSPLNTLIGMSNHMSLPFSQQRSSESPNKTDVVARQRPVDNEVLLNIQKDIK
jgi:hypothetical protein